MLWVPDIDFFDSLSDRSIAGSIVNVCGSRGLLSWLRCAGCDDTAAEATGRSPTARCRVRRGPGRATSELELRSTDSGANVLLIEAVDAGSFAGAAREDGIAFAAASQVAADLLTSPGRGPQEAEELIDWMTRNEDAWRG